MGTEKSDAIVLKVVDFSETSCVVTLFSRDFGKLSLMAKGARRPKNPFDSALDVLSTCRVVFLRKSGPVLHLLTEAKLERRFRWSSRDLQPLYQAYYVAELLLKLTDDMDPHPQLYELADRTLLHLTQEEGVTALLRFQLEMLGLLGHAPGLDACVECDREVRGQRVPFGLLAGGVLCDDCRRGQRLVIGLTPAALDGLRSLIRSTAPAQVDAVKAGAMAEVELVPHDTVREKPLGDGMTSAGSSKKNETDDWPWGEMRHLIDHYITHLIGRPPRMVGFLQDNRT